MATSSLNKNNSAVKRIMQEAKELANDPSTDYSAAPLEDDIFEWHCTLRGPAGTDFEGGLYHFRILLPAEYPFRPPSLMMLTPNGRFELNTKICISFTSYHEELWQPAWGVRTAILGLQGFFPLKGQNAVGIGSIEYPSGERKRLAALSREWVCPHCNESNLVLLPDPSTETSASARISAPTLIPSLSESRPLENTPMEVPPIEEPLIQTPLDIPPPINIQLEHQQAIHSIATAVPSSVAEAIETPGVDAAHVIQATGHRGHKPPLLLDTMICILLVLAFAIICRRVI